MRRSLRGHAPPQRCALRGAFIRRFKRRSLRVRGLPAAGLPHRHSFAAKRGVQQASRCGGPDGVGVSHASRTVAWASRSTRSARWRQVVWPRWSLPQDKRIEAGRLTLLARAIAADALTRRAIRADTQQSDDRVSDPAAACLLFVGWVLCETHLVGVIAQASDIATGGGKDEHR